MTGIKHETCPHGHTMIDRREMLMRFGAACVAFFGAGIPGLHVYAQTKEGRIDGPVAGCETEK